VFIKNNQKKINVELEQDVLEILHEKAPKASKPDKLGDIEREKDS
jgi:hypothetical protein